MFKLLDSDSIKKQIVSIGKAGARLAASIQIAALQVLAHAVKHGDVTLAQQLVAAAPGKFRASLVAWFEMYGPFAYDKDTKALKFYNGNKVLHNAGLNAGGGMDVTQDYIDSLTRWEGARKDPEVRSLYDMSEECGKFFDRMQKLATSGKTVSNVAMLNKLIALYRRETAGLDETNIPPEMDARTPEGQAELATQFPQPAAVNG